MEKHLDEFSKLEIPEITLELKLTDSWNNIDIKFP